ncbi:hypothetical protein [Aeromicrobium fastidiosum]|uniref:Uncharacterized protein n=1 Tax=Aeromicrobium fastidiosum TaxID=52699 RepID=A0A641AT65_9ACTN|nr:hypothetical protein [Aeromicrobium fastidiosum]KAA1380433.1 hypothetical protein ESP62_004425 [Aeromicrobium fastidiosum]MBP2390011.1 hypothetical protein [Aeromicrobium fastidiosum]
MNRSTRRHTLVLAALGMTFAVAATPIRASADDIDEDAIAARLCPAGAGFVDMDSAEDDDRAEVGVYTYEVDGAGQEPDRLCTFAIISTDDDATLDGSYTLNVGGVSTAGAVVGSSGPTSAVLSDRAVSTTAVLVASGRQTTTTVTPASKAAKKKATKARAKAVKKAKKAYAAAGRTTKAKKILKKKLAAATKKYLAAKAPRRVTTVRPYRLDVTLAVEPTAGLS